MDADGFGILNDAAIARLMDDGAISAQTVWAADQRQPASLDLRLGDVAYRLRASFLPRPGRSIVERLDDQRLVMHRMDLSGGAVLETGCVYLVPLMETLRLPADVEGAANPKSSTGRLDVFTRVIAEGAGAFDRAPAGYEGPLYAEISPRTFSVLARAGDRLAQMRFRRHCLAQAAAPTPALRAITLSVDVSGGFGEGGLIGFRAKRHAGLVDLAHLAGHPPQDYWEPLAARDGALVLDPGEFYILASQEAVQIPHDTAAEMAPMVAEIGEFRAHYAGFFDPGFGMAEAGGAGARAVLEVRGRDVPFMLEHGQSVARLVYEPMIAPPETLYGAAGSHYQGQGLRLSKHFAPWPNAV